MADKLQIIQERNKTFKDLYEADSMGALSDALYADDCKMMVPNEKTTEGKEDTKKLLESLKAEGAVVVNLRAIEVGPFDGVNMLYERGDYEFAKTDKTAIKMGKYLVVWKMVDGLYKRYIEIFNSGNNSFS